jgi:hypothetical protein
VTHFHGSNAFGNQCNVELLEFVEMLSYVCEHRGMHEACVFCGNDREFMINWPKFLMSLWRAILVIPTSIVVCEHGFLKQNLVESNGRTRLNLDTLDASMRLSLNGSEFEIID